MLFFRLIRRRGKGKMIAIYIQFTYFFDDECIYIASKLMPRFDSN